MLCSMLSYVIHACLCLELPLLLLLIIMYASIHSLGIYDTHSSYYFYLITGEEEP